MINQEAAAQAGTEAAAAENRKLINDLHQRCMALAGEVGALRALNAAQAKEIERLTALKE